MKTLQKDGLRHRMPALGRMPGWKRKGERIDGPASQRNQSDRQGKGDIHLVWSISITIKNVITCWSITICNVSQSQVGAWCARAHHAEN